VSIVIDSSLTLAWYFPDEKSEATDALLWQVVKEGAIVPAHWHAEVANGFQMAVRRKRIDLPYRNESLTELTHLDIVTDPDTNTYIWNATVQLADLNGLTIYDAAYLISSWPSDGAFHSHHLMGPWLRPPDRQA
jgi:predicted nucleic acid-binding protein